MDNKIIDHRLWKSYFYHWCFFVLVCVFVALYYHFKTPMVPEIEQTVIASKKIGFDININNPKKMEFKKIEQSKCITFKDGVYLEVHGECDSINVVKPIQKNTPEPSVYLDPKVIHPNNVKFYNKKYEKAIPEKEVLASISSLYGLPEPTLYYQMMIEGRGKVNIQKNSSGAKGYHQFLDSTAVEFGLIADGIDYRTNPYASADAAARYLLWIGQTLYGKDVDLNDINVLTHSLAAYNAGYRRVAVDGEIRVPRFYETIRYTQNIIDLIEGNATLIMPNETLGQISLRTGFSKDVLLQSNFGINSDEDLKAFEVLQLPINGVSKVIVKKGMSLSQIGHRSGVKVSAIKILNNLSSDIISISDIIMIPTSLYVKT